MNTLIASMILTAKLCSTPECSAAYYKTFALLETMVGNVPAAIGALGESKSPGWGDRLMNKTLTPKDPTIAKLQVEVKAMERKMGESKISVCELMRGDWEAQRSNKENIGSRLTVVTSDPEWKSTLQANGLYTLSTFPQLSERARAVMQACPTPTPQDLELATANWLTPEVLYRAYHANEVKADATYKSQTVFIKGTVESVTKDFTDSIVIRLATGAMFREVRAYGFDGQEGKVANLEVGNSIKMKCLGAGMVMGGPLLRKCTIL